MTGLPAWAHGRRALGALGASETNLTSIMNRMSRWFGKYVGLPVARWALGLVSGLALVASGQAAALPPNTIAFSTNIYVVYDTFVGDYYITNLYGGGVAPVSVGYSVDTANLLNTAVEGVDYILTPGTVTFQAGVLQTNFVVQILSTCHAGRSLFLKLSNPTVPAVLDSGRSQAELRILPEPPPQAAAGEFSFSRLRYVITDREGPVQPDGYRTIPGALITINRQNGDVGRVRVHLMLNCATDPAFLVETDVFFDHGQTSTNFFLPNAQLPALQAAADTIVDLQLSNPSADPLENTNIIQPSLSLVDPVQARLTIVNTRIPGRVSLSSVHQRVDEYGTRTITVGVSYAGGCPTNVLNFNLVVGVPGNYTGPGLDEGSDFATPADITTSTIQYSFSRNQTFVQHTITVNDDTLVEFNEDIGLDLRADPGNVAVTTGPPPNLNHLGSSGNLTILFDEPPPGAVDREWAPANVPYTTPPFNTVPGANNQVQSVAVQPDGKTVLGGDFTGVMAVPRYRIARLNFDGSLDTAFCAHPNTGADNYVSKVVVLTNGATVTNILIAGGFTSYNGTLRRSIARLMPDGSLDTGFFTGAGANGPIWDMAVQADGKIVIAGSFTRFNETDRFHLARLNADGSLDATFDPGTGADDEVLALGFDRDQAGAQKIYLGGRFTHYGGVLRNRVARINPNGTLDPTFDPGQGVNGPVFCLVRQNDGKVVFAGNFSQFDARGRSSIVRVNVDGFLDTTFDPRHGSDDSIYTIRLHPDGRIYIGGVFTSYNDTRRWGLALLRTDGTLDTRFMDSAYNQFAGLPRQYAFQSKPFIKALALQADGNLVVGGSFTNLGGNHCRAINDGVSFRPVWTRQDKTVRYNIARLIGTWGVTGGTPNPQQGPGNVEFAFDAYSVDENQGSMPLTMTRVDGLLGTALALAATSNRTATAGLDFLNRVDVPQTFPEASGTMVSDGLGGPVYFYVPIFDDTLVEGNEVLDVNLYDPLGSITLGGEVIPLGAALGHTYAPLTIVDNDYQKGTFAFSSPTYTVTENGNGTNAILTVVRTNGYDGAVSVDFYTVDAGARAGRDYQYTSNRLDFASGETVKTIQVPIINEAVVENYAKTFYVVLTNATGGATLPGGASTSTALALVTIIDKDYVRGRINFNPTNYTVNEADGSVTLTLERMGGSVGQITNRVITRNGTALAGVNYQARTNVFTWLSGDVGPKTFTVPILWDGVITPDRTFQVAITNATLPGDIGILSNSVVRILNTDNPGSNCFSQALYMGDENGTNVHITVLRRGGVAGTNTVLVSTADDTAMVGTDYVGITNLLLTFLPGVVSVSFDVQVIDNSTSDAVRSFNLILHHGTNSTVGSIAVADPSVARFVIIDDESLNEPAGSVDVTYGTGFGPDGLVYALQLQPDTNLLVGGTFTNFDNVPENRLARLLPGGGLDSSFNVNIGFNGNIRAMALQPDGKVVTGGEFTTFNSVNRSRIARLHHDGSLDEYFNPGAGADGTLLAIAVQPADGRILIGGEFNTFNGSTWPNLARLNTNGTLHTAFNVGTGPDGPVYAIALQTDGKILIGGAFTNVNNVPRSGIARLWPDGRLDTSFAVSWAGNLIAGVDLAVRSIAVQSDGRILMGGAFTNSAFTNLARLESNGAVDATFLSGLSGPNDAVYAIAIQVDEKILVGGAFTRCNGVTRNRISRLNKDGTTDPSINFGLGANGFVASIVVQPDRKIILGGGFTSYDGHLRNNLVRIHGGSLHGSGVFEFSTPYFTAVENMPVALIQVMRRGGTFGPATINYMTFDGTATDGLDYTGTPGATLSFPQGEVLQEIALPIIDDLLVEDPETVYFLLDSPSAGTDFGVIPMSILTIISDDATLGFDKDVYLVSENTPNGAAAIRVVRFGDTNSTLQVEYSAIAGTATTNDFVSVLGTLYFGPGVTDQVFLVPIVDDLLMDGNKTVLLTLTNSMPTNSVSLTISNAVLNIIDNEGRPGVVSFDATNYLASKFITNATVTVIRTNGSQGIVSVSYTTRDGTATNGVDYLAVNGMLSFADGEALKTFSVPILHNPAATNDKILSVYLSNPLGGAVLGVPTNATVTISEMDVPPSLAFAATNFSVHSWDTNALISVVRSSNTMRGLVLVDYLTRAGTAVTNSDYTNVSGTLRFDPDLSGLLTVTQTFLVPVVLNPLSFTPKTVSLLLTNARFVPYDTNLEPIITLGQSVLTILPNDLPGNVDDGYMQPTLDNPTPGANGPVYALALQPDGQCVVGGDFTRMDSILLNRIARMQADGVADPSFNPGQGANAPVYAVALTPDLKIVLGGAFTRMNTSNHIGISRLLASGVIDPTFNPGMGVSGGTVRALAVQSNGQILLGGDFLGVNGQMRAGLARIETNGSLDGIFTPSADGPVYALAVQRDGMILVGGGFTNINGVIRRSIARLTVDGIVDTSFVGFTNLVGPVYSIAVQADDRIVVGGAFTNAMGLTNGNALVRLLANGSVDTNFNTGDGLRDAVRSSGSVGGEAPALYMPPMPRIVGGQPTTIDKFPYQIAIISNPYTPGDLGADQFCGGSILNRRWILTAAHCMYGQQASGVAVAVGVTDLTQPGEGRVFMVDRIIVHPGYNPATTQNDVALMHLTDDINFTDSYVAAPVPIVTPADQQAGLTDPGVQSTITGWGNISGTGVVYPDNLHVATVPITATSSYTPSQITPDMLLAGYVQGGVDTCQGDSGGPLVVTNEAGMIKQAGVTSWGYGCAVAGYPGVYARVSYFYDWITTNSAVPVTPPVIQPQFTAVNAVGLDPSGRILIGGSFTNYNGASRNFFARVAQNGALDQSFKVGSGANAVVRALVVQPDTATIIGGDFTAVNGIPRAHLARIHGNEKWDVPGVEFAASVFYVLETNGPAVLTVRRTGNPYMGFSVDFATRDGTATNGVDYRGTNMTLSFAVGEMTKTVFIPVLSHPEITGNKTVYLTLSNAPVTVDLMNGQSTAVLVIVDAEKSVRFSRPDYFVPSYATNATIEVVREGNLEGLIFVTFQTMPGGTAVPGVDYSPVTNFLVFAAGQTNRTAMVPVYYHPSEGLVKTALLVLTNPMGCTLTAPSNAWLHIRDVTFGLGSVDMAFNPGAGAGGGRLVRSMSLTSEGKIVVGGAFKTFNDVPRNYVARLAADGALDTNFNVGVGPNSMVFSVAALASGKTVIGGTFTTVSSVTHNFIARLLTNGAVDTTFARSSELNAGVTSLAVQNSGKVVVGGGFTQPLHSLARIRNDGSADISFDVGTGADSIIHAVSGVTNGTNVQLLVGGAFSTFNGLPRSGVARLSVDGSVDVEFTPPATNDGIVFAVMPDGAGRVLVGGSFTNLGGSAHQGLARLNGDGLLDETFTPVVNGSVFTIVVQPNGKILIGGDFSLVNQTRCGNYARLLTDGSLDQDFDASVGADGAVYAVLLLPDNGILIGGSFDHVDDVPRSCVARLLGDVPPLLRLTPTPQEGGVWKLTFNSVPGAQYFLEASPDLSVWTPIFTNTAVGYSVEFVDLAAAGLDRRFYRAVRMQP